VGDQKRGGGTKCLICRNEAPFGGIRTPSGALIKELKDTCSKGGDGREKEPI